MLTWRLRRAKWPGAEGLGQRTLEESQGLCRRAPVGFTCSRGLWSSHLPGALSVVRKVRGRTSRAMARSYGRWLSAVGRLVGLTSRHRWRGAWRSELPGPAQPLPALPRCPGLRAIPGLSTAHSHMQIGLYQALHPQTVKETPTWGLRPRPAPAPSADLRRLHTGESVLDTR